MLFLIKFLCNFGEISIIYVSFKLIKTMALENLISVEFTQQELQKFDQHLT